MNLSKVRVPAEVIIQLLGRRDKNPKARLLQGWRTGEPGMKERVLDNPL